MQHTTQVTKQAFAIVLAGGRGSRLMQLTDRRSKPAVYFGGKFRIIDFTLSNCLNSGIRRISVATQYKSHSLLRHLQRGWSFLKSEMNEFIDLLPAQQRLDENSWYRGTADAVFQNLDIVQSYAPEYIVILAGDHIYKMDYGRMLADHVTRGFGCTVGCFEVPLSEAHAFGVMDLDAGRRIARFIEKSPNPPSMPDKPDRALASMGIYIFNASYLYEVLQRDSGNPSSSHDFGKDIIPQAVEDRQACGHPFGESCVMTGDESEPYWRDVGTVDAYWEANIDLTATQPKLDMYDREWPIWTHQEQLPPAKFVHNEPGRRGMAVESIVSGGCIISGALYRSLLFSNCRVHSYTTVNWSVLLPEVHVGRHARLTKVIVDHGCMIPEGTVIGEDPAEDARRFYRTDSSVVLVTREMLARLS